MNYDFCFFQDNILRKQANLIKQSMNLGKTKQNLTRNFKKALKRTRNLLTEY